MGFDLLSSLGKCNQISTWNAIVKRLCIPHCFLCSIFENILHKFEVTLFGCIDQLFFSVCYISTMRELLQHFTPQLNTSTRKKKKKNSCPKVLEDSDRTLSSESNGCHLIIFRCIFSYIVLGGLKMQISNQAPSIFIVSHYTRRHEQTQGPYNVVCGCQCNTG